MNNFSKYGSGIKFIYDWAGGDACFACRMGHDGDCFGYHGICWLDCLAVAGKPIAAISH